MNTRLPRRVIGVLLAGAIAPAWYVLGCPFCTAVSRTFSEEFATMDAVVIAQLERLPSPPQGTASAARQAPPAATFTIVKVLKGEAAIGQQKTLVSVFHGDGQRGDKYLVTGIDPPALTWSTPLKLNDRQHQYLLDLMRLPQEGAARLVFFQQYLEDSDSMLSQDAYDEFARAPYAMVKELKPKLNHDQLVAWIKNPKVSVSHRRLYFTLLGVCGDPRDLPMLEQRLRGTDAQAKSGLDALIACYLTLRGPAGVQLIEELFLANRGGNSSDNYADVYAAIMALRFHGTEGDIVPRQRVLQAFGLVLDKPQMADLIIPDLARWQDWSQLDRLVEMFKTADTNVTYVRMPIINYVRACPLPAAQQALEDFNKIDPEAVKRSMTFFPTIPKDPK
jgi:hypothetical protein